MRFWYAKNETFGCFYQECLDRVLGIIFIYAGFIWHFKAKMTLSIFWYSLCPFDVLSRRDIHISNLSAVFLKESSSRSAQPQNVIWLRFSLMMFQRTFRYWTSVHRMYNQGLIGEQNSYYLQYHSLTTELNLWSSVFTAPIVFSCSILQLSNYCLRAKWRVEIPKLNVSFIQVLWKARQRSNGWWSNFWSCNFQGSVLHV